MSKARSRRSGLLTAFGGFADGPRSASPGGRAPRNPHAPGGFPLRVPGGSVHRYRRSADRSCSPPSAVSPMPRGASPGGRAPWNPHGPGDRWLSAAGPHRIRLRLSPMTAWPIRSPPDRAVLGIARDDWGLAPGLPGFFGAESDNTAALSDGLAGLWVVRRRCGRCIFAVSVPSHGRGRAISAAGSPGIPRLCPGRHTITTDNARGQEMRLALAAAPWSVRPVDSGSGGPGRAAPAPRRVRPDRGRHEPRRRAGFDDRDEPGLQSRTRLRVQLSRRGQASGDLLVRRTARNKGLRTCYGRRGGTDHAIHLLDRLQHKPAIL